MLLKKKNVWLFLLIVLLAQTDILLGAINKLIMYSGFAPRMISTPNPRFRLTLQSGQSMQRSLNPFEPIMTPIGDLSHEYGQRYNVYRTPIPYHASNMQGSLNLPGTVTVSATSTAVSSSINTTRSVAFATPRRQPTSSWERFLTDVFPDPLANYRYEYRDGTTQTCSNRLNGLTNPARYVPTSSNPSQSVQTDQLHISTPTSQLPFPEQLPPDFDQLQQIHSNNPFLSPTHANVGATVTDQWYCPLQTGLLQPASILRIDNYVQTSQPNETNVSIPNLQSKGNNLAVDHEVQTLPLESTHHSPLSCHSCKKDDVDPPTYNGKEKWDTFISLFEKVADLNEWDNANKCKRLMISLRSNALEFVDTLQFKITKDYDSLKSSLAQRFGVTSNESLYRLKFKSRRRNENETIDWFIQDLQYLAERAFPNERGPIYHRLIVEQFIEGIGNKDYKNYLQLNLKMCKENDRGLLQEVLKYAHNDEAVMGKPDRVRKPYEDTANAIKPHYNSRQQT